MSVEALRECYLPALRELLPRAREAKVEIFMATREHAATFRAAPGVAALRPGPADGGARPRAGRRVDRHRLARHARGSGAERTRRGGAGAATRWAASAGRRPVVGAAAAVPGIARGRSAVSDLLIAAPLRLEALLIRSSARGARVRTTGMGPRRARPRHDRCARSPADALLVLGFCGGLDERSKPGEVVVADRVLAATDEDHDPEEVDCADSEELLGALAADGTARAPRSDRVCLAACARRAPSRAARRRSDRGGHGVGVARRRAPATGRSRSCASCSTARRTSCCARGPPPGR